MKRRRRQWGQICTNSQYEPACDEWEGVKAMNGGHTSKTDMRNSPSGVVGLGTGRADGGLGLADPMAGSFQQPKLGEHLPPTEPVAGVHLEQPDGGASCGGFAHDTGPITGKVIGPPIASRMEQRRQDTGVGIDPAQVGALLEIALGTGEREVGGIVGAAVLPGDDVFHVGTESGSVLREAAIFAMVLRPLAHPVRGDGVHLRRFGVGEECLGFGLEDAQQGVGADDGFQFDLFGGGQLALGAFAGQLLVAGLRFGVGLDAHERVGQFGRELLRERSKQPLQCGGLDVYHADRLATKAGESESLLEGKTGGPKGGKRMGSVLFTIDVANGETSKR